MPIRVLQLNDTVYTQLSTHGQYQATFASRVETAVAETLVIHNCNGSPLQFDISVRFANLRSAGQHTYKDYSSIGEHPLPAVYLVFAVMMLGCLSAWVCLCLL